jgi:hypothetical protein
VFIGGQSEVVQKLQYVQVGIELKSGMNLLESLYNFGATSGSVLNAMPLSLYSRNRHSLTKIQIVEWTSGPLWTDMESFVLNTCNTYNLWAG